MNEPVVSRMLHDQGYWYTLLATIETMSLALISPIALQVQANTMDCGGAWRIPVARQAGRRSHPITLCRRWVETHFCDVTCGYYHSIDHETGTVVDLRVSKDEAERVSNSRIDKSVS